MMYILSFKNCFYYVSEELSDRYITGNQSNRLPTDISEFFIYEHRIPCVEAGFKPFMQSLQNFGNTTW